MTKVLRIALLTLLLFLSACVSTLNNGTAYPYKIFPDKIKEKNIKKIIIANENFGGPSKKYLQPYEYKIDQVMIEKLEDAGYDIVDDAIFKSIWRAAIRKYGTPYNTYTSQLNGNAFRRIVAYTFQELREKHDIDAIVFTDILEQLVTYKGSNTRLAKWHGVSRRPRIKGGSTLSKGFDWTQTVPGSSLRITVYASDGTLLFRSFGGLEVTRQLDVRKDGGRFVRREKLFDRPSNLHQGVLLALHPFVPTKYYSKD